MKKDFGTIIKASALQEIPEGLNEAIFMSIEQARRTQARRRFVLVTTLGVISLAAFFPAYRYAAGQFSQTGFGQYLSIAFSDHDVLLASWKELAILLAGSLPLLGVTALFSTVAVFLVSARAAVRNAYDAFPKRDAMNAAQTA